MASTQVKGHRLAEKSVRIGHLEDTFVLPESRLNLNFPTHSNAGDLTVAQKNTLTQLGNADGLHYHTGGGGGPQGIYTNEERDVQLLKLSMLINATTYGMDKSVKDLFMDDASIYYGIKSAAIPTLLNRTDDPAIGGLLPANTEYSYGISYKNLYGETDIINTGTIRTAAGTNNAIELKITEVVPQNSGAKIYRSIGQLHKVIVENENINEWENPYNLDVELNSTDKTSGLASFKASTKGFVNSFGNVINNAINIAAGVGKRFLSAGEQQGAIVAKTAPFDYFVQINNKEIVNRLDVVWNGNPAMIPAEYEIYYTTDYIPSDITNVTWKKFSRLSKIKNFNNVSLSISTDGSIVDNYKIQGNTKAQNVFIFKSVSSVTAIRIKVTSVTANCQLDDLRLFTEQNSTSQLISKDFVTPQDFKAFKTLKVDVKSNYQHKDALKLGFIKNTEVVASIATPYSMNMNTNMNLTGNSVRQQLATNGTFNYNGYDRIRIAFKPVAGQYLKIENAFLMLDTRGHSHSPDRSDCDVESIIIPLTFNNGLPYYEGTPTGDIYCDWVPILFPNQNFYSWVVSFRVVSGSLQYNNSTEYCIAYTSASSTANGLENSLKWNGYVPFTANYNWSFISFVQVGKSNSQYMDFEYMEQTAYEKWHRHYIPMPTGANAEDIRKLALFFNDIRTDQDVFIDNVALTRAEDLVPTSTITSSNGCINHNNVKLNDATYFVSDLTPTGAAPKSIMFEFAAVQNINKLLVLFDVKNSAAKTYAIQYSLDNTANVNDPFDSPKWMPVTNLKIGEPGITQEFTGTISNNAVFNNNLWSSHICNNFTPVDCTKIRFVVFGTMGDLVLRIPNIKIMTAKDTGELKLIYEKNTPVVTGYTFIDDAKPTQDISPSLFNTTGSYNVIFDSNLKLMKLIDPSKNGVIHMKEITMPLYQNILMSAQYVGDVRFFVSNNGGATYVQIPLDKLYTFSNQSTSLRIKVELRSSDALLSALAFLYSL